MEQSIKLTDGQKDAVAMTPEMKEWKGEPRIFRLIGPAGSGKTASLKEIDNVAGGLRVVTPTGRAALVVIARSGIMNSSTLHRFQYIPIERPDGTVKFRLRGQGEDVPKCGFLTCEEASMYNATNVTDILKTCNRLHLNIFLVGDGAQLQPIPEYYGAPKFSCMGPDFKCYKTVKLTEVMRQALDSPILRAATAVRQGKVKAGFNEIEYVPSTNALVAAAETIENGGVVICHTNVTRHNINRALRQIYGFAGLTSGEPLLVLRNNYNIGTMGRFNGEVLTFQKAEQAPFEMDMANEHTGIKETVRFLPAIVEGDRVLIAGSELGGLNKIDISSIEKQIVHRERHHAYKYLSVCYGYALTAHKMQGSEADDVLVVLEKSIDLGSEDGIRWAYTSITRAKKRCRWTTTPDFSSIPVNSRTFKRVLDNSSSNC